MVRKEEIRAGRHSQVKFHGGTLGIMYSFGVTGIMVYFTPFWSQVSHKTYRILSVCVYCAADIGQALLMHYSAYSHNNLGEYYDYPSRLD